MPASKSHCEETFEITHSFVFCPGGGGGGGGGEIRWKLEINLLNDSIPTLTLVTDHNSKTFADHQ